MNQIITKPTEPTNIVSMAKLKAGDKFRYINADENQVCMVTEIDEENKIIHYNSGNTHMDETNDLKYPINIILL